MQAIIVLCGAIRLLSLPPQNTPHRRANWLIRAVNATDPTTRAAFASAEVFDQAHQVFLTRRFLLGVFDPANPFVAHQRREALPGFSQISIDNRPLHFGRDFAVDCTSAELNHQAISRRFSNT